MVRYTFDAETNTTRCIITVVDRTKGEVHGRFVGKSTCNPNDQFDEERGKLIAYKRAMLKLKKAEVKFHLTGKKVYAQANRLYELHTKAYDHNVRRVNELKEELSEILKAE